MNIEKLKRTAVKEFKRSPGKTGVLLALVPVALYFCIPLLLGTEKKNSDETASEAEEEQSEVASFVILQPKQTANNKPAQESWMDISRWLENDLMAVPAGIPSDARNPFAALQQEKSVELLAGIDGDASLVLTGDVQGQTQTTNEQFTSSVDTIRDLGLQLSATMVGQRLKLATINGRSYEEGETIPVVIQSDISNESATMQLKLIHVARRFVELEMNGHQHRLKLRNDIPKDAIVIKPR